MSKRDMKNIKQTAAKLEQYGRNGDTMLAHITPEEAQLLKSVGGSGTINPKTGLPEYFIGKAISAIAGPVLNIAGGLLGGGKAADAAKGQAEALRAAGDRASAMAQFKPMGMTTAFGTSAFTPEGQGSFTLSPELRSLQQSLFGQLGAYNPSQIGQMAQPLTGGAQSLFNLGGRLLPTDTSRMSSQQAQDLANQYRFAQQGLMPTGFESGNTAEAQAAQQRYQQFADALSPTSYATSATPEAMAAAEQYRQISSGLLPTSFQTGASPEAMAYANQLNQLSGQITPTSYDPTAAAQQYYQQQQELMQPGRAAEEARLATANYGRGTGGLGVQTGTGTAPSNPLAQALFNARAQQDRTLAAQSTDIARQRLADDIGLGTRLGAAGLSTQQQSEATNRANMLQNIGVGTDLTRQALSTQQQSEATQRANLLQNMGLAGDFTGAALRTQQQDAATQRANLLQNLGLSLEFGTQGLRSEEAGTQLARERFAEDLRLGTGLFGTGGDLLGQVPRLTTAGYGPTEAQLGLLRTTETMGQDPFRLSQELAGRYAQAGANAGNLFMQPQAAAANAYAQYQGYSPIGSALSSIGSTFGSGGFGGSAQGSVGSWFDNLITRQSNQANPGFVGPSF